MGYTLELWALRVRPLEAELASPSIHPAALEDDDTLPADVVDRWEDLAGQVAAVVASRGGEVAGLLAVYVHAVVRALGTHYGALDHASGGGEEFRRRFLPGPAAARYGHEAVAKLVSVDRPGMSWGDYPVLGWLGADKLTRAVESAAALARDLDEASAHAAPLDVLDRAMARAAAVGIDLVAAYG